MEKKWISDGYNISYPYDWQRPAKTEEWTWEYLNGSHHQSNFIEFVSFPWATLIDLMGRKQDLRANALLVELNKIPPKKKLIRATICQHVNLKEIIYLLKKIKITDIFWPHKIEGEDVIDGVRVHPYVLYPYAYFERNELVFGSVFESDYLVSFIGAYDEGCYLSNIRERIFKFNKIKNSLIVRREKWHFEVDVYECQINNSSVDSTWISNQKSMLNEYIDSLSKTAFVLCPSGAGPNTIRYWEAIAFGRVPVLLSDTWDPPNINIISSGLKLPENSMEIFLNQLQEQEKVMSCYKELILHCEKNKLIQPNEWLKSIFDNFYSNMNLKKIVGRS